MEAVNREMSLPFSFECKHTVVMESRFHRKIYDTVYLWPARHMIFSTSLHAFPWITCIQIIFRQFNDRPDGRMSTGTSLSTEPQIQFDKLLQIHTHPHTHCSPSQCSSLGGHSGREGGISCLTFPSQLCEPLQLPP